MKDYVLNHREKLNGRINPATRLERNMAALKLVNRVGGREYPRQLDVLEQSILVQYSGWGALAPIFEGGAWQDQQNKLREVVTPDVYAALRASVNTAYFTPPWLARAAWEIAMYLGLDSGRVLDLGCGTGNFCGVKPVDFNAKYVGVEIDPVSAKIAQLLYPNAEIIHADIRHAGLKAGNANLVVGNVPFDSAGVFDAEYDKKGWRFLSKSLHTYFIAKSIDCLAPGGLAVLITSTYTLDAKDDRARQWMAERAEFLGAVRLPRDVFKNYAGAQVSVDVLILRKRADGERVNDNRVWVQARDVEVPALYGRHAKGRLNVYYEENPHMMLGELVGTNHGRFGDDIYLRPDRDLTQLIIDLGRTVNENLTRNVASPPYIKCELCGQRIPFGETCGLCLEDRFKLVEIPTEVKDGAFFVKDSYVYRSVNGDAVPVRRKRNDKDHLNRIDSMAKVRDATVAVLNANLEYREDKRLKPFQRKLLAVYLAHINRFGFLNARANRVAFSPDPDCALIMAIEDWDARTMVAKRRAIFSQRVVGQTAVAERAESAQDALVISLNEHGSINWSRMVALTGQSREKLAADLEGAVFQEPDGRWTLADEYLSGEVGEKLAAAVRSARDDDYFEQHVTALRGVLPVPLTHEEINVQLGASWIDPDCYARFLDELLLPASIINRGIDGHVPWRERAEVCRVKATGQWTVGGDLETWRSENVRKWGTPRYTAVDLVKTAMNNRSVVVRDYDVDGRPWVNHEETIAAKEKLAAITEAFSEWLWRDEERRRRMVLRYNRLYNEYVPRQWDGRHLQLVGTGKDMPELRPNQRNAIWRIMNGGNTLLWHDTGAGKTLTMICAGMEMRRLGMARKVVHVTLSNTLDQYAIAFHEAYPTANLLLVDSRDMVPKKRREMVARMATGDYDAILMTQDAWNSIRASTGLYEQMMAMMIDQARTELYRAENDKSRSVRDIERAIKRLEKKVETRLAKSKTDKYGVTWEMIGADLLFIDEAHNYKNLYFPTNMTRVAGVGGSESGRAFETFLKCQYTARRCVCGSVLGSRTRCSCVRNERAKGQVVLATATALSNSIAEIYTWMRYMIMDTLIEKGLEHFDAWVRMFAEVQSTVELKPSGRGHRINERLSKFANVPELLRLLYSFSDNVPDIGAIEGIKLPKIEGGEPTPVMVEMSEQLEGMMDGFEARAENLSNVKPWEDNILTIMTGATLAAVDPRLRGGVDEPGSKINTAVRNIFEIWRDTRDVRLNGISKGGLAQCVFLDHGTPGGKGVDLYRDMREKLVALGVPRREIRFIHEAKKPSEKEELFALVNQGIVRILVGGTQMMAFGSNFQALLCAQHEIDPPWRPLDVSQRRGRIVRPGNLNETVRVFLYSVRGSFDAYRWQILENKARFIHQIQSATLTERVIEDVNMDVIDFAQMKALTSDDPKVQRVVALEAELRRLFNLRAVHQRDIREAIALAEMIPGRIERLEAHADRLETAVAEVRHRASTAREDDSPLHSVRGWSNYKTVSQFVDGVLAVCSTLIPYESLEGECVLWGFDARLAKYGDKEGVWAEIDIMGKIGVRVDVQAGSRQLFLNRVRRALEGVGNEIAPKRALAERLRANLPNYQAEAQREFKHASRLIEVQTELEHLRAEIEKETKDREQEARQASSDPTMESKGEVDADIYTLDAA